MLGRNEWPLAHGVHQLHGVGLAQKHTHVAKDFAANPLRNRLSILLCRTSHVAYHLGQTAMAPK